MARWGSMEWKKTCSMRPERAVRTAWKVARTHEPCTLIFEVGVRKVSCSIRRLSERLRAESALYTARLAPLKSASSPCAPFMCGSPVMPDAAAGDEGGARGGDEGEGAGAQQLVFGERV
eukprot:5732203-Prymnesium_polylepis.1